MSIAYVCICRVSVCDCLPGQNLIKVIMLRQHRTNPGSAHWPSKVAVGPENDRS